MKLNPAETNITPSNACSLLRVEQLSESYGTQHVLQDVSFSVEAGERVALVGPSGQQKHPTQPPLWHRSAR